MGKPSTYAVLLVLSAIGCGSGDPSSMTDGAVVPDARSPDAEAVDARSPDAQTVDARVVPVASCTSLPEAGTWESISPGSFATFAFAVDHVNAGTVYVGTFENGIWKTTDCGASWV